MRTILRGREERRGCVGAPCEGDGPKRKIEETRCSRLPGGTPRDRRGPGGGVRDGMTQRALDLPTCYAHKRSFVSPLSTRECMCLYNTMHTTSHPIFFLFPQNVNETGEKEKNVKGKVCKELQAH